MQFTRAYLAMASATLLLIPAGSRAAEDAAEPKSQGFLNRISSNYRPSPVPAPDLTNSNRLDSLLRAGNIYLSLADAIALALENNLDIAIQRYSPQIADAYVLHTRAGGFAPGVTTSVFAGPASVGGTAVSSGLQSLIVIPSTAVGITPPNLDTTITGNLAWAHSTAPQSNTVITGTFALVNRQDTSGLGVQRYFLTGTQMSFGLTNSTIFTNSARSSFSPATSSALALTLSQHLLQGFGRSVNGRQIRIAQNNREISDLTFKSQVITTVSAICSLYWDLVSFDENVKVKRDALATSQRLLSDNRKQTEVGTLAPISVVQAEAEVAADQQALVLAETQMLQQEVILKNALSRTGISDPLIASAHVIPTDTLSVPQVEAMSPVQDVVAQAMSSRPEPAQFRMSIQNEQIAIRGLKNELMPVLDVVGTLQNNGLAGEANPLFTTGLAPPVFTGGYGTVLSQIFARHFPNYALGFSLNIPLGNRAARADYAFGQLSLRQQQLGLQKMENQIRVEVQNALIGLQQARAQYEAAIKQRVLEEQTVDAEQKKLAVGISTTYNVILTQRDLVTAQSNEVAARSVYAKAGVELDRVTGQTLYSHNISVDEAFQGKVSRPPSAIPASANQP